MRGAARLLVMVVALFSAAIANSWANSSRLVFRNAGIAITVPESWSATNEPFDYISNPVQRLVLSSYPLGATHLNGSGAYIVPRSQVLAQVMEVQPPPSNGDGFFPPRPARFAVPTLTDRLEGHSGTWGVITFCQKGRDFYIFVGVGSNPGARVGELLHALDAMTVAPS